MATPLIPGEYTKNNGENLLLHFLRPKMGITNFLSLVRIIWVNICKTFGNLFSHFLFGNIFFICSCHTVGAIKINGPYDMATFVGHKWPNICKVGDCSDARLVPSPPSSCTCGWSQTPGQPFNSKRLNKDKVTLCWGLFLLDVPSSQEEQVGGNTFQPIFPFRAYSPLGKSSWSYRREPDCGLASPVSVQSVN